LWRQRSLHLMMTPTGNASNLRWQEVGRRKGVEEVVVKWDYSVALVCLVGFVSKRFVNEIIKKDLIDNQISQKAWLSKRLDNQVQIFVWLSKGLIIKPRSSIIKSIKTKKKAWYVTLVTGQRDFFKVWSTISDPSAQKSSSHDRRRY
jgi:hypothetical protein